MDQVPQVLTTLESMRPALMQFAIAGAAAAGGLTWFVKCWSSNKYKIQIRKRVLCDTFGGLAFGYFMSLPLMEAAYYNRGAVAFVLGLSWGGGAQYVTEKITGVVLRSLGEAMKGAIRSVAEDLNEPAATKGVGAKAKVKTPQAEAAEADAENLDGPAVTPTKAVGTGGKSPQEGAAEAIR